MLYKKITPKPLKDQYEKFKKRHPNVKGEILKFKGVDGMDVYNPSVPFMSNGIETMACRVERRNSEHSLTMFFTKKQDVWTLIQDAPTFELQDPFVTFVDGELILGGVYVIWEDEKIINWRTDFYRGTSIYDLEYLTRGPMHMKDVRLLELPDGKIAIFSRPQGKCMIEKYGCIAKIGINIVDSLDDISADTIDDATLLHDHFLSDEWGGCNQLFNLKNGLIGAIGHKSSKEVIDGNELLHYYSMAFAIDPNTFKMTPCKVISCRECFPEGQSKKPRLRDVTFTSGIIRHDDGTATLYTGLNDCQVGKITTTDPLAEYEEIII